MPVRPRGEARTVPPAAADSALRNVSFGAPSGLGPATTKSSDIGAWLAIVAYDNGARSGAPSIEIDAMNCGTTPKQCALLHVAHREALLGSFVDDPLRGRAPSRAGGADARAEGVAALALVERHSRQLGKQRRGGGGGASVWRSRGARGGARAGHGAKARRDDGEEAKVGQGKLRERVCRLRRPTTAIDSEGQTGLDGSDGLAARSGTLQGTVVPGGEAAAPLSPLFSSGRAPQLRMARALYTGSS